MADGKGKGKRRGDGSSGNRQTPAAPADSNPAPFADAGPRPIGLGAVAADSPPMIAVPTNRPEPEIAQAVPPASEREPGPMVAGGRPAAAPPPPITGNWTELPEKKEDFELPLRTTPDGTLGKGIVLRTNHFPLTITFKQDYYFRYDVKLQRVKRPTADAIQGTGAPAARFPKRVLQKLIKCLVPYLTKQMKNGGHDVGIATDFISNMYSTMELELMGLAGMLDMQSWLSDALNVDPDPHEVEKGQFEYTLIRAADIPTREIAALVNNMRNQPGTTAGPMADLETMFNAVIKAIPTRPYLCVGRSLVEFPENDGLGFGLGGGLRAWPGVTVCINPGWKFFLNLMLSFVTVKVGAPVLDALKELFGGLEATNVTEWTGEDVDKASEYMNTTKITYSPIGGKDLGAVVERVSRESVSAAKFDFGQPPKKISVFDYYKVTYGRTLKYPDGPVLVTRPKGNLIPAEICKIKAGQSVNRKLDKNQTTEMKNVAQKKPDALESEINNRMRAFNLVQNELFARFGMSIDPKMLELKGRVLPTPTIRYKNVESKNLDVTPQKGVWMVWQHRFLFQKPNFVNDTQVDKAIKWSILGAGTGPLNSNGVESFKREMQTWSGRCGMKLFPDVTYQHTPRIYEADHSKNVKIFKEIFSELKKQGIDLVIVVLPGKPSSFYAQAKQAAELEVHGVGIMTQGILRTNFAPANPIKLKQIVQNLLLKIQSKLGGVTHHVIPPPQVDNKRTSFMKEPTMILGADVRHPTPGSVVKDRSGRPIPIPSFAAVTASIDPSCMPTMMDVRAQVKSGAGAEEVIRDLEQIVANMLLTFGQKNKCLPRKILYFRDGVGEGQFKELLHVEMRAIRNACSQFDKYNAGLPYEPKITFMTVQKRHKTRFFIPAKTGATNAEPGTVIDTDIVYPTEVGFYLQSHAAIQGTSHPTKYHLLHDDNDYSMDELQIMTYCMCHMYVRCNRSVKIPAATYYAHWSATRAQVFAEGYEHLYADLNRLNKAIKRDNTMLSRYPMHFI